MRKLFSHYGLLAIALVGSFIGIGIFINAYFNADSTSIRNIIGIWIDHLL